MRAGRAGGHGGGGGSGPGDSEPGGYPPWNLYRKGKDRRGARTGGGAGSGRRDLRRRTDAGPAAWPGGEAGAEGHGPDAGDSRHLREARLHQRGQAPGGDGPAKLPAGQAFRSGKEPVPPGRRHRNERAGREKAGDRPAADPKPDGEASPGAFGYAAPPGHGAEAAAGAGGARGGHRGLYERGKVHASQRPDRGGHSGAGSALCHARSHHPAHGAFQRPGAAAYGHGRLHPKASPPSGGGFSEHPGGSPLRGFHPACGGQRKPSDRRADGDGL